MTRPKKIVDIKEESTVLPTPEPEVLKEAEQITFMLEDGKTEIIVPCPLTAETWFWILDNCRVELDPNETSNSVSGVKKMFTGIVMEAKRILSIATGVKLIELESVKELEIVINKLMSQIRGEWLDLAPFSNKNMLAGITIYQRTLSLLGYHVSEDGSQSSVSLKNSEEASEK